VLFGEGLLGESLLPAEEGAQDPAQVQSAHIGPALVLLGLILSGLVLCALARLLPAAQHSAEQPTQVDSARSAARR
jgi:hypothetical protein